MRFEEVKHELRRVPFRPCIVRMVSGTEYRVTNPETIVSPRFAAFLLPNGVIEVAALEYIEAIRPSNGSGKRRVGAAHRARRRR